MTDLETTAKSFWARPEGKVGAVVLVGGVGAGLFYGWGKIVPFVLETLQNTVHAGLLATGLVVGGLILASPRTHTLFRVAMYSLTDALFKINPVAVLKDHLLQMRKRRDKMNEQIQNVSGEIRNLKGIIEKNEQAALEQSQQSTRAIQRAQTAEDRDTRLRMALAVQVKANKANRLKAANISYQDLLGKLEALYSFLNKWSIHIDAYIEDTEDEVKQNEVRFKTINAAHKAFMRALRASKGSAAEDEIFNSMMEHMAEVAGRKLGEMEDMQRVAQKFMDDLDLTHGEISISDEALAKLASYEQKLLTPGTTLGFLKPGVAATAMVTVPGKGSTGGGAGSDYFGGGVK